MGLIMIEVRDVQGVLASFEKTMREPNHQQLLPSGVPPTSEIGTGQW